VIPTIWIVVDGAVQTVAIFDNEEAADEYVRLRPDDDLEAQALPLFSRAQDAIDWWAAQ
jgi:hypothetical protein